MITCVINRCYYCVIHFTVGVKQAEMPFCHESVGLNTSSRHCYVNIIKIVFVIALQARWQCSK